MKVFIYPDWDRWAEILKRPDDDASGITGVITEVINQVREQGDEALAMLTERFDKWKPGKLMVDKDEIHQASLAVPPRLKKAILLARQNIETFHKSQHEEMKEIEPMPGVRCWRKSVAIERVGLYIPGGTAPLVSTLLMLGVPARLAGCKEVIVCSPALNGMMHPAILYTASLLGIQKVFKIGGAQAIAAMAYGSVTVPRVDKIFGPGNRFVTGAKQWVSREGVAIDLPAGPSEVAVYADETSSPAFVAADLLSQCEHGRDSQAILVSISETMVQRILEQMETQKKELLRRPEIDASLTNSKAIVLRDVDACFALLNDYAPEHLIIASDDAENLSRKVINAGSVFLGSYSPESAGDYASGTNHTLPTSGYAKAFSGVSLDSFVKKITFQKLTRDGLRNLSDTIVTLAEAEGLGAHKNAVLKRFEAET